MVYYCPERETIVLHFSKPLHRGNGNLTINFSGNLTEIKRSSSFFKLDDSLKLVTTNFGPIDARYQFPCWDEPKFRANFDLYMVVPKDNVALFNENFDQRRPYTPDFDEIRFLTTPKLSTFQLSILYGPRLYITNEIKVMNSSITMQLYSSYFHNPNDWNYALKTSEKLIQFYQYYFNQSYPINKLDLVVLRNYEPTSMEKLGLLLFSEHQLLITNQSQATEEELHSVTDALAHSLAHQWIGNLVTFQHWNEFWFFEALATFSEKEALNGLFPQWRTWEQYIGNQFRRALNADSSRFTKPLDQLIMNPNDVILFYPNENGYCKAVALLRMIRFSLGDEVNFLILFYLILEVFPLLSDISVWNTSFCKIIF